MTSQERDTPAKSWTFTLNNYTGVEETVLQALDVTYLVYGREVGEQETPHLQGCVTFVKSMRLSGVKKLLPRGHWEKAKALENARNYCMKDGDFFLKDNRSQGKRTDLQSAVTTLKTDGIRAVAENHSTEFVKYANGFQKLAFISRLGKRRHPDVTVHWLFGSTGTGKTRAVFDVTEVPWTSHPGQGVNWFDGYMGQDDVLFDDLRWNDIKFNDMLRITDRYPLTLSVKGGFVSWEPRNIFITNPVKPQSFYGVGSEDVDQLLRRIDHIWNFPTDKEAFYEYFEVPVPVDLPPVMAAQQIDNTYDLTN